MPALAWHLLQLVIIRSQRADSPLAQAIGRDFEGKVSPVRYIAGILLAFIHPRITCATHLLVALLWLVPDRRMKEWPAAFIWFKELPGTSDRRPP